ncbi:hypothetical protein KKA27_02860 [Patescibacteria group bacterium]|nr:hypothetical protein [Patescibacteria group bacterium]
MEKSPYVDISIDQGGCIQSSQPTTHKNPVFKKHGVIYYCVTNMPGIVPRTATKALAKETLPYILYLADAGCETAIVKVPALAKGVNTYKGRVTHKGVANALGIKYTPLKTLLK